MSMYKVTVSGSFGVVYEGQDLKAALEEFKEFVILSETGEGDAQGEDVEISQDGDLLCGHFPR